MGSFLAHHLAVDNSPISVYGEGGLTSGCSSDLQKATHTATQMVKVRISVRRRAADDEDVAQNFGFSGRVGPVFYSDQNGPVSPQTSERIDSEILG